MARVSEPVAEHAIAGGLGGERLEDLARYDHSADRRVAGRQTFCDRHHVRLNSESLATEPVSRAPEPADDLVRQVQDAIFSDDRLHGRQIALGRRDHASRAHHGFCDEGGNRFRPLVIDECLEVTR